MPESDLGTEFLNGIYINGNAFEQMPSNSDNFLQIELSGISSSCGFEDVYFSLSR